MKLNNHIYKDILTEFNNFIKGDDIFSRKNKEGHITASCWIINKNIDSVLLTHHKKLNIWIPTGGHSEGETDPVQIALREGEEETGLKLKLLFNEPFHMDIHNIPLHKNVPAHKHFDYTYLFCPQSSHEFVVSPESFNLKWIPLDKIEEYTKEINVIYMRDKTMEIKWKIETTMF